MMTSVRTPTLQFLPIPLEVAENARRTRKDEFGHELEVQTAAVPCRVCLRISTSPENVILLSYQPLPDRNPYAEIGPIFIHAHDCDPYDSTHTFPKDSSQRQLVIRAYDWNGRILDATVARPGAAEQVATEFLSNLDVDEVHVRQASYTCFDFKIVRTLFE